MKKKICFNIADIHSKGGEERMCTTLANSLVRKGYTVCICSFFSHKDASLFYPVDAAVNICHLLGSFWERRVHQFFPGLKYAETKYKSYLKKKDIEVIIDVDTDRTPFSAPIAKELGIKHIAWDHFYYGRFRQRACSARILPHLLHDVDKLVVLTKDDERLYKEDAKIPGEKIVQIYNASPIEEVERYQHDRPVVLAMGRLCYQKGFDMLIEAWHLIAERFPDWTLRIVGDGEDKQMLQDQLRHWKLTNVVLVPATKNPKEEYLNAGIFVLSSRYEGLGLVLLEAANMSLPLVSFDCDNGPREIIQEGVNGCLVPPNDVPQLAKILQRMMEDTELRQRMSAHALDTVSSFRTERILRQWMRVIDDL